MPPQLALLLCTVLVVYLLRLDRKQSPAATPALWIPTIWMLYIAGKPIGVWFRTVPQNSDSGSSLDQAFLIALMILALIVLARRRRLWALGLRENPWVLALLAFMFVSVLWSDIPAISFKRWIREFQALIMALAVLSEPSPREALESVLRRSAFTLIPFSLLLVKYFPIYGVEYGRWSGGQMWVGVAQQKNGLATLCMVSAVFLIWSLIRRGQKMGWGASWNQTGAELLILSLTLYLFAGPRHSLFYSATSTYALLAGMVLCVWIAIKNRSGSKIKAYQIKFVLILGFLLGVTSVIIGGSGIKIFASTAGRDATLTGRTGVWTSLLPSVLANPILGSGFGGFWTSKTRDVYQISGAHSGYLDVLLGIGFLGLILVVFYFLSSSQKAHTELSRDIHWGMLWLAFLVISAVHNVAESSIDSFTALLSAVILFFTIGSTRQHDDRQARRQKQGHAAETAEDLGWDFNV